MIYCFLFFFLTFYPFSHFLPILGFGVSHSLDLLPDVTDPLVPDELGSKVK